MKKAFLLILGAVYAFGCGGCRDEGLAQSLGQQSILYFNQLDQQTAQKIGEIIKKVHYAHQVLEVQNRDILIQSQKILQLQAVIEKETVFNQEVINKLQDIINTKSAERGF